MRRESQIWLLAFVKLAENLFLKSFWLLILMHFLESRVAFAEAPKDAAVDVAADGERASRDVAHRAHCWHYIKH